MKIRHISWDEDNEKAVLWISCGDVFEREVDFTWKSSELPPGVKIAVEGLKETLQAVVREEFRKWLEREARRDG